MSRLIVGGFGKANIYWLCRRVENANYSCSVQNYIHLLWVKPWCRIEMASMLPTGLNLTSESISPPTIA